MSKKAIRTALILFIGVLLLLGMSSVATAYTTDCEPADGGNCFQASADQTDIANAINDASAGDTVRISPGTATFSSRIDVDKSLHIIGAGIDVTIIEDDSAPIGTFMLSGSGFVRLSSFTLTGQLGSWQGSIRISSSGDNKRIDNIRFNTSNGRHPINVYGNLSNVVIDNCTFESANRGVNVYGNSGYWTDESQYAPGTVYGVYIEDCTFNASGVEVVDIQTGGAYIVRHCTINNGGNLAVHGADSGERSGGYIEVYENEFSWTGSGTKDMCVILRGGSAIIFNNSTTGRYNQTWKVQYWRSCYGVGSEGLPFDTSNRNRCEHNSSNPLDGNFSPENNGWPCKDQPGIGANHSSKPIYAWNNSWDMGTSSLNIINVGGCSNPNTPDDHVIEGRDFFQNTMKPGYTPLTYPHPLVSGEEAVTAMAPPTDLTVVQ